MLGAAPLANDQSSPQFLNPAFRMQSPRYQLARAAARRVAEGEPDYFHALAKAEKDFPSFPADERPTLEEIDSEVAVLQAIHDDPSRIAALRGLRKSAQRFMRALTQFNARLLGPVATGTAIADSPIWIELGVSPTDSKEFEIELINRNWQVEPIEFISRSKIKAGLSYRLLKKREEALVTLAGPRFELQNRSWSARLTESQLAALLGESVQ